MIIIYYHCLKRTSSASGAASLGPIRLNTLTPPSAHAWLQVWDTALHVLCKHRGLKQTFRFRDLMEIAVGALARKPVRARCVLTHTLYSLIATTTNDHEGCI